jgi:SNF2 family DNA or RNA helicase
MQKVKNPAALVTRAAQTLNADFVLGLTGTPVENRLEDLWSIFDIVEPGRLGDLKSFSQSYRPDDRASLERLRAELLDPQGVRPPAILRRFKGKELPGLPAKHEHPLPVDMPPAQAEAYRQVVERAKAGEGKSMLETLHALRGISLHPVWPSFGTMQAPEAYIAQSARLAKTIELLDRIRGLGEKALVFVESLEMQDLLAELLQGRYRLRRRPLQIKGDVAGYNRQKAVRTFQAERGFDVMLLTPKAGGVGLTLTAANHVIHLSRWWNPAVEDQSTDRIYRIGQDREVHVYYPMAVHPLYRGSSFDEILHRLLERKRALARELLVPPIDLERDGSELYEAVIGVGQAAGEEDDRILADIDRMDPGDFERWALRRMQEAGYVADGTPRSHDGGADGVMVHRSTGARVLIQCKHRQDPAKPCREQAIDDLLRARTRYAQDAMLVVLTNARTFTPGAVSRADRHGIRLVGRNDLPQWPPGML